MPIYHYAKAMWIKRYPFHGKSTQVRGNNTRITFYQKDTVSISKKSIYFA